MKTSLRKLPVALPVTVIAIALAVLLVPLPTESLSVIATRALSQAGFAIPGVTYISDATLATLAAATLASLVWSWRQNPQSRLVVMFSATGVVLAYGASEISKLLFHQARPCGRWPSAGECDLGDYSFPSNHTTLAFGAVMVIAFALNRVSVILGTVLLAITVAVARVLEGAHYLHDVAAGAALGISVPGLIGGLVVMATLRWRTKYCA